MMTQSPNFEIHNGDALDVLRGMADNSVDAIVTDPPAGIAFMGKDWDKDKGGRTAWIGWMSQIAAECLRVLKPGAHALVWAIPRTSHWTATAWEDAGFEVRDRIAHIFGSGFPKSLNLKDAMPGWGTALKPAVEDWWLLRKPISESTIAGNVLKWGTGGLNVDGCRVSFESGERESLFRPMTENKSVGWKNTSKAMGYNTPDGLPPASGRFPANFIHDGSAQVVKMFPMTTRGQLNRASITATNKIYGVAPKALRGEYDANTGSAARFFKACPPDDAASLFYCAKASRSERNAGLDGMEAKHVRRDDGQPYGMNTNTHRPDGSERKPVEPKSNFHPCVKPQSLMKYLCRLITPPNGTILDPFFGSGSTGVAAITEGFSIIGIEQDAEFAEIARRRCEHAKPERKAEAEIPPLLAACEAAA